MNTNAEMSNTRSENKVVMKGFSEKGGLVQRLRIILQLSTVFALATLSFLPPAAACVGDQPDGTQQPGESCDDGNTVCGDGCDPNCHLSGCGSGRTCAATGEECDDGNTVSGDGCDSNCTVTACGNGIVTAGEECDDGNTVSGDSCSALCLIDPECPETIAVRDCDTGVPALLSDGTCAQTLVDACLSLDNCGDPRTFKKCLKRQKATLGGEAFRAILLCASQTVVNSCDGALLHIPASYFKNCGLCVDPTPAQRSAAVNDWVYECQNWCGRQKCPKPQQCIWDVEPSNGIFGLKHEGYNHNPDYNNCHGGNGCYTLVSGPCYCKCLL